MSVAENGDSRRLTPADVVTGVRRGVSWVIQHPKESLIWGGFYTLIAATPIGSSIYSNWEAPIRKAEAEARESAQATATAVVLADLTRDYNETGGVDITRQQESYLVIPRGSARIAGSEGALLDSAWARVKKDSGCQPSETIILPEVPGAHPWDRLIAPKSYVVRISCQ